MSALLTTIQLLLRHLSVSVLLILFSAISAYAEQKFGGHIKYQVTHSEYDFDDVQTLFTGDTLTDHETDGRLTYELQSGAWQLLLHGEGLITAGDRLAGDSALGSGGALFPVVRLPDDSVRLMDLTGEFS